MAIRQIYVWGNPVLHQRAQEVTQITDEIRTLVADMFETMEAAPGVGLAAPQIGVPLRIFTYTYDVPADDPSPDAGTRWRGVVINPELMMEPVVPETAQPLDEEEESEGCLSFPDYGFPLRRSAKVRVEGIDLDGKPVKIEVEGWRARIMQHEFDHLNGYLYINRLNSEYFEEAMEIAEEEEWRMGDSCVWNPAEEHFWVDEYGDEE